MKRYAMCWGVMLAMTMLVGVGCEDKAAPPPESAAAESEAPSAESVADASESLGETAKVTMLSVRMPRSTRLTLPRLFRKRPAEASSASERAIWAVTRPLRKRWAPREPEGWPVLALKAMAISTPMSFPVACSSG